MHLRLHERTSSSGHCASPAAARLPAGEREPQRGRRTPTAKRICGTFRCGAVRGAFRFSGGNLSSFLGPASRIGSESVLGRRGPISYACLCVWLIWYVQVKAGMHARRRWTYVLMCRSDLKLTG